MQYVCAIWKLFKSFFALHHWNCSRIFNSFFFWVKRYMLSLTHPNHTQMPQFMVLELRLLWYHSLTSLDFPCLEWWSGLFSAAAKPGWERGAGRGLKLNQLKPGRWTSRLPNGNDVPCNNSSTCYMLCLQLTWWVLCLFTPAGYGIETWRRVY